MNTATAKRIPLLKPTRYRNYEILLEDLEFIFSKKQLRIIKNLYNDGKWITEISEKVKRNEYEVLLAIIHLHRKRELTRPIAFRSTK